jgi:selenide,water dikinase
LGTGIICNALRKDLASVEVIAAAVASMTASNRGAADALRPLGPHAVVDVTGFGLVGHLHLIARESGCASEVDLSLVPALAGALELIDAGAIPGGTRRNRDASAAYLEVGAGADEARVLLACDAQTSGGLLAAVPADTDPSLLPGPIIGRMTAGPAGTVALI